ncbi:MAG: hypothetical protein WKF48_09820 [Solirubrobacteraceae bacterium]
MLSTATPKPGSSGDSKLASPSSSIATSKLVALSVERRNTRTDRSSVDELGPWAVEFRYEIENEPEPDREGASSS